MKNLRYSLKNTRILALIVTTLLALTFNTSQTFAKNVNHTTHSLIGSHGMVLFQSDDNKLFASHLPLYYSPHNYQIIYEVSLPEKQRQQVNELLANQMVTILPDNFDLTKLISGKSFSINSQLFNGHFERGGKLFSTTELQFKHPVFIQEVSTQNTALKSEFSVININAVQAIAIHHITKAPSFDAIGLIPRSKLSVSDSTNKHPHLIYCKTPKTRSFKAIKTTMKSCGMSSIKYIETQDFN